MQLDRIEMKAIEPSIGPVDTKPITRLSDADPVAGASPIIGLFQNRLDHVAETIVWHLLETKNCQITLITDPRLDGWPSDIDHPKSLRRLMAVPDVTLASPTSHPTALDLLIVNIAWTIEGVTEHCRRWKKSAQKTVYVIDEPLMTGLARLKQLARLSIRGMPNAFLADGLIVFSNPGFRHPYFTVPRTFRLSPHAHPALLFNSSARRLLCEDILTETPRRYQFSFIGNINPAERNLILNAVRPVLHQLTCVESGDPIDREDDPTPRSFFECYGTETQASGLSTPKYLRLLHDSHFTLCPPGYSPWTHRVVEALCCGSIPILEEPEWYGLTLRDGQNCLVVDKGDWPAAIKRAANLTKPQVARMHTNIKTLRDDFLFGNETSDSLCNCLGLNVPTADGVGDSWPVGR